jgi:2-dehydropantoate 2-reductase
VIEPGVVVHHKFSRFILGEPDGQRTARVEAISDILLKAGFDAPIRNDIRWSIWLKLWGNVCFNPLSALTHAPIDRITREPGLRAICTAMMYEAKGVAEALNVRIPEDMIERRLAAAGSVTGHKMSMLQDLYRLRSMEIDALVTAVQELGRLTETPTPTIDVVLALVQERARQAGLYSVAGRS